jgi:pyridoxamine 5'-phosphate oxidase
VHFVTGFKKKIGGGFDWEGTQGINTLRLDSSRVENASVERMSSSAINPFERFNEWFEKAKQTEPAYPDAMSLATSSGGGFPHVRIVLLKGFDERGFTFYTNFNSHKGQELKENARAALCFHWKSLERQVRVEGEVEVVSEQEADEYFASRARISQLGAWASKQSEPLESRFELEKRVAEFTAKFHIGKVPRPPHWSGFRLKPVLIEFWEEKAFRLHDRIVYRRGESGEWTETHLYP